MIPTTKAFNVCWRSVTNSRGLSWASAYLSYAIRQRCDMTVVISDAFGGSYSHFALALPLGSAYTERLNVAVMEMRESHYLEVLRMRWFQSVDCNHSANDAA